MAHPDHHAESSARKFGGCPSDYRAIHNWFDATKAHCALPGHRALRHSSLGIFEAERVFGRSLTTFRRIPSVSDWLADLPLKPWMVNGMILPDTEPVGADPQADWRAAVASGRTTLGFPDWLAMQAQRLAQDMDRSA